ncbi:MAG: hypothetical protein GF353_03760 [Candidatus Lokiarchaeota archaeon]|nr:hypothetical protein [Candidatus Lokiarchaeota archaeon]
MKKKLRLKYMIAIYTIIASLSIIFWILAYFSSNDIFQATLINLATELLGVVFIFFIVNYLFSMDEWDTSERIDRLLEKLEKDKNTSSKDFFVKKPSIDDLIKESKYIDLCGVTLSTTIDSHLSLIRDAIRNGVHLRVLIMELNDETLKVASRRSEEDDEPYYKKKLDSAIHNLEYLYNNSSIVSSEYKGKIEIGFLNYPPSFGMKIFKKNEQEGISQIEIYPHHVGWGEPPIFSLNSETDDEWYSYFQEQFDAMWGNKEQYKFQKEK